MASGGARLRINASPERLWQMVSDVTRMGEWSPETERAEWLDGATGPAVGARFRGYNRRGPFNWSTVATVTAADPGREFAFTIALGGSVWRYKFEPSGDGTLVTESYELPNRGPQLAIYSLLGRPAQLEAGMLDTLRRLKAAAEAA